MSFPISFRFDGWEPHNPNRICRAISGLVRAVAEHNRDYFHSFLLPPLYASGVRYRAQTGADLFEDAAAVYHDGHGDCKNLVAWRLAEVEQAEPLTMWRSKAQGDEFPYLFHVVVIYANGVIEDPSRILGMGKEGF